SHAPAGTSPSQNGKSARAQPCGPDSYKPPRFGDLALRCVPREVTLSDLRWSTPSAQVTAVMIGHFTVKSLLLLHSEWSLWRWVTKALGQVLACLAYRPTARLAAARM